MPVGFNSPARNLFLLGSTGAQVVTNFFKTIDQSAGTDGVYLPDEIRYNVIDQKYILAGSASDSQSKDFGWFEKRAQDGSADWQVKVQSTLNATDTILRALEIDNNDNLIVVGKTGTVPWVAKYTNGGVISWQSTTNTAGLEYSGIAIDSNNNIYACGNTPTPGSSSQAFVEKFDSSGNPTWGKSAFMIGRDVILTKCAVNSRGEVIAVGIIEDDSAYKGYIVKINANTGDVLWDRTIRSYEVDISFGYEPTFCEDVYVDGNDQIYVVGRLFGISETRSFIIKYSPEGNMLWQRETPSGETIQHYYVKSDTETEQTIVFSQYFGLGGVLSKYSKNGDLVFRRVIYSSYNSSTVFGPKGLDADPSSYYVLYVDDVVNALSGTPKRYTFGKVSSSGNGFGNFTYSEGTGQTIYYQILNVQDKIGRLSDGSVRQDTSDLLTYPFNANKILFDDLATQIANKKVQIDEPNTFQYGATTTPTIAYPKISPDAIVYDSSLLLNYDFKNKATYPGTGTSTNNLSSTSYTGTITGTTFNSAGYFHFNQVVSDVIQTNITIPATARSYFIWIRYTSITGLTGGYALTGVQEVNAYTYLGIEESDPQAAFFYYYAGTTGGSVGVENIYPNIWYQQGFVMNSDGSRTLYLNGQSIGSSAGGIGIANTAPFKIGHVGGGNHFINGDIGELQLYTRALTAAEVSQNFNATRAKYGV